MSVAGPPIHREESTTAYGVSVFAGVLLVTLAAFEVLQGLSALLEDDLFVAGLNYVYAVDVTAWGVWHIVLGAVGVAVGAGILRGRSWANVMGIGFAVVSSVSQFMFMPYYPFWSVLIIAMNVLVIWALAKRLGER